MGPCSISAYDESIRFFFSEGLNTLVSSPIESYCDGECLFETIQMKTFVLHWILKGSIKISLLHTRVLAMSLKFMIYLVIGHLVIWS